MSYESFLIHYKLGKIFLLPSNIYLHPQYGNELSRFCHFEIWYFNGKYSDTIIFGITHSKEILSIEKKSAGLRSTPTCGRGALKARLIRKTRLSLNYILPNTPGQRYTNREMIITTYICRSAFKLSVISSTAHPTSPKQGNIKFPKWINISMKTRSEKCCCASIWGVSTRYDVLTFTAPPLHLLFIWDLSPYIIVE